MVSKTLQHDTPRWKIKSAEDLPPHLSGTSTPPTWPLLLWTPYWHFCWNPVITLQLVSVYYLPCVDSSLQQIPAVLSHLWYTTPHTYTDTTHTVMSCYLTGRRENNCVKLIDNTSLGFSNLKVILTVHCNTLAVTYDERRRGKRRKKKTSDNTVNYITPQGLTILASREVDPQLKTQSKDEGNVFPFS